MCRSHRIRKKKRGGLPQPEKKHDKALVIHKEEQ